MDTTTFSFLVWAKDTNEYFFRDLMESIVAQRYFQWELYVMDETGASNVERIVEEFFPGDARVHHRRIKNDRGQGYAYNVGLHFILQEAKRIRGKGYIMFMNQHDRLSASTLEFLADAIDEGGDVIYTDEDCLVNGDRMYPQFKPCLNVELLRHRNYIGDFFAISYDAVRTVGQIQEKLHFSWAYDYLLRALEADLSFVRVPQLLYHRRLIPLANKSLERRLLKADKAEHMVALQAHLSRIGLEASVEPGSDPTSWNVIYDGRGAITHQKEYLLLRNKGAKPVGRHSIERMYGYIKQKDVAVVGGCFYKSAFMVENCGYIFDDIGVSYPAFYEHKTYQGSYMNLASIPRDVSAVDAGYCMIDAKVYRKLGGFTKGLSGRDVMLDFCLRAREAGFRTVVVPQVSVFRPSPQPESTQSSSQLLLNKWEGTFIQGDPYYSPNLPLSLNNYKLF